ncbi:unnamed protein product [Calypogeia fissa]
MSGQSFKEFYDADYASLSNLCAEVKSVFWRISYMRNESGEELPRALSFEQCPCKVEDKTGVLQHVMKEEQASDPEKMLADTQRIEGDLFGRRQNQQMGEIVEDLQPLLVDLERPLLICQGR